LRLPPGKAGCARRLSWRHSIDKEIHMPVILWLLGVPLTVVLLLMFLHVL
jgi:hypothetical protein